MPMLSGAAVSQMNEQKVALSSPLAGRKWPPPVPPDHRPAPPPHAAASSAPPGRAWTFVRAKFPFEYENDQGRLVRMNFGDRYRLINRSNDEWWQVLPMSLPDRMVGDSPEAVSVDFLVKHSYYIPANYVEEVAAASPANSLDRFCGDIRPSSHKRQGSTGTSSSATPDFRDDSGASNDGLEATLGPTTPASSSAPAVTPTSLSNLPYPLPTPRRMKTTGGSTDASSPLESSAGTGSASLGSSAGAGGSSATPGQKPPVSAAFLANLEGKIGSLNRAENQGSRGIMKTSSLPLANQRGPPSPPASSTKPSLARDAVTPEEGGEIIYANIPPHRLTASTPGHGASSRLSHVWELPGLKQVGRESEGSAETEGKERPTISGPVMDLQTAEKRGHLSKTKVMENSKRVKKNWTQHFVLLRGPYMYFFKDQKAPKSGQPHGKAEFTLALETVHQVPVDSDLTKRSNVIALEDRGAPGSSVIYYLKCEDAVKKTEWTIAISMAKKLSNRSADLPVPGASPFGASPKRRSIRRKDAPSKSSSSTGEAAGPAMESAEKQNVISLLMDLFRRRQPVESLREKGIIRNEPVFGSTLEDLAATEKNDGVPNFLTRCVAAIESRSGLSTQGLYRVNGNGATIQRLRCLVDQTTDYDLMDTQWELEVLTGALKLFFRELKEPLIPCNFYDQFVSVAGIQDKKSRLTATKKLINSLPSVNLKTMKHLFHHLTRVVQHSSENQMQTKNVAIVFGPNLLWPAVKASSNTDGLTATVMWQNQIVEYILSKANDLFSFPPPLPYRAKDDGARRA